MHTTFPKASAAMSAVFASAGVIVAQVQGTMTQLQTNLPTVLIIFSAIAGLVGIIYAVTRALYALHAVAAGWVKELAGERVISALDEHTKREEATFAKINEQLGAIREVLAELRGERRILKDRRHE